MYRFRHHGAVQSRCLRPTAPLPSTPSATCKSSSWTTRKGVSTRILVLRHRTWSRILPRTLSISPFVVLILHDAPLGDAPGVQPSLTAFERRINARALQPVSNRHLKNGPRRVPSGLSTSKLFSERLSAPLAMERAFLIFHHLQQGHVGGESNPSRRLPRAWTPRNLQNLGASLAGRIKFSACSLLFAVSLPSWQCSDTIAGWL